MAKRKTTSKPKIVRHPKECSFCKDKKEPKFSDATTLKKFLTERGKIIGRSRNGLCPKHQKELTLAVKHARHLALLPFVDRG